MEDSCWRQKYQAIIERMWDEKCKNPGLCQICGICGGSSVSTCNCAKASFLTNLTEKEVEAYSQKVPDKTFL